VESTNSVAASFSDDPANDGLVVLADEQTAGRGRQGRSWFSPCGAGVWLSALLFPSPDLRRPVVLAAWAAISVCETIRNCADLQAQIKWPNDVLIEGRKVSGILIEQGHGTVVGIGLNVNQKEATLREQGLPQAGSIAIAAGRNFDTAQIARALIRQLDAGYHRLCQGDRGALESCWQSLIGLSGRPVMVECTDVSHRGFLSELTWAGLLLQINARETIRLVPETIKHISEVFPAVDPNRHI
jgi:BirA family biotin operon repressor/biotin-[acetyl-CoA-carboxylase] ligase